MTTLRKITARKGEDTRTMELRQESYGTCSIWYAGDETGVFKRQMSFASCEAGLTWIDENVIHKASESGTEIIEDKRWSDGTWLETHFKSN